MNVNANSVWSDCLKFIKDNIQPQAYKTWFEPIKAIKLSEFKSTFDLVWIHTSTKT